MPTNDPTHERGAGDHDQAYQFNHLPSWTAPAPFTLQQLSHLLFQRSLKYRGEFDDDTYPDLKES